MTSFTTPLSYAKHCGINSSHDILINFNRRSRYLYSLIHRFFPTLKATSVLDLGCGYGSLLLAAKNLGYEHIFGVDSNPLFISYARQLGLQNVYHLSIIDYLYQLPSDKTFDVICLIDVLEHFSYKDAYHIICLAKAHLSRNGFIFLQVPNSLSQNFGSIQYADITHISVYNKHSLSQLFSLSGYATLEFFSSPLPIHNLKDLTRYILSTLYHFILFVIDFAETGSLKPQPYTRNILMRAYN